MCTSPFIAVPSPCPWCFIARPWGLAGGEAKPAQRGAVCCCARLLVACADAGVCVGSCSPAAAAFLGAGYLRGGTHANISDPCPLSATLARWPRCLGPYLKTLTPTGACPCTVSRITVPCLLHPSTAPVCMYMHYVLWPAQPEGSVLHRSVPARPLSG
jgi:hypothetical protein